MVISYWLLVNRMSRSHRLEFADIIKKRIRRRRIEAMYSVHLIKKAERSDSILHNSAVRYSIFCGLLLSRVGHCADRIPVSIMK